MIAAAGEIVGALGVVASLVYVGRQVRLSNALARAEAYRVVSLRVSEMTGAWASDEGFLRIARNQGRPSPDDSKGLALSPTAPTTANI